MTSQFKSFLSDLADDTRIKAILEQETTVDPEKLFEWIKEARRLYLTAKLTGQGLSPTELDEIQQKLKQIVLFLESIFVDEMVDNEKLLVSDYDNHFVLLGMIFEYLGDFQPGSVTKLEAYNWYLHSSLCYSLGNSPANSIVLAKKFGGEHQAEQKLIEFEPEQYLELAKKCVLLFLTRSMHRAKRLATELSAWNQDVSFGEGKNPIFVETIKGYFELVEFVQYASNYMLTGEQESIENSRKRLQVALHIFVKGFCSFESLLADRLILVFEQMIERSIWVKLENLNKKRPEYLKALVAQRPPITELWPSQIAALEQYSDGRNFGMLGNEQRNFIVSMPTSAGKTRVAEIVIADVINPKRRDITCIYVVPTRALVNQVANDLSVLLDDVGYSVGTAAGSYENIPGLEDALIENVHILVTTPEKLDMLDRSNATAVRQCKLYVFDECHKLEDAGRGLRLEILISRLKHKNQGENGARFVLLSAVLPRTNLGEFVEWLGAKQAIDFFWRPTRLLEGIVYKELGSTMPRTPKGRLRREQFYGVEYPSVFGLEKLVKGTYFPVSRTRRAEESLKDRDIAAALAVIYSKLGSVLIYCPTREEAQSIALRFTKSKYKKGISGVSAEIASRRNALADLVEERIMKGFPLAELVRNGIAYHHAYLPTDIKKEIETAIKNGDINIITATTTLAEGLNTPVKTVIFADVIYDVSDRENRNKRKLLFQVDPKQFRNIAGRAGRALHDTEGHIILLDFHTIYELFNEQKYSTDDLSVTSSFREVLDRRFTEIVQSGTTETTLREFYLGADATINSPVRSRFFDLITKVRSLSAESQDGQDYQVSGLLINENTKKLAEEERVFQSGILALVCEQEFIDPNASLDELTLASISENGMRSTLFAHQMKDRLDILEEAIQYTKGQTKFVSSHVDKVVRQVYNRTGLSLGSCIQLDEFIQNFIRQENGKSEQSLLKEWRGREGHLVFERIREFLGCVSILVETRPTELRKIELKTSHEDVLYDWITGNKVVEIVERNFRIKPSEKTTDSNTEQGDESKADKYAVILEATNYIYSYVVTFSSWAIGAACTLLKHRTENMNIQVNPEIWLLPAYTLYGVDTPIACFCIAMGINDREVASTLARKYPTNQIFQTYTNINTWGNVKWWFSNITKSALENWLNSSGNVDLVWESIQKAKRKFNLPEIDNYQNYLFSCNLRGLIHDDRAELIKEVYVGYVLRLVREDNDFDKNAIRAELEDGRLLGYIPRELAANYAPVMDDGTVLYAQVRAITRSDVSVYVFKV